MAQKVMGEGGMTSQLHILKTKKDLTQVEFQEEAYPLITLKLFFSFLKYAS